MKRVLCIGELLVDWFPYENHQSLGKAELLQKRAGGAPANVAVTVSALGGSASLMAHVGVDPFGKWLREVVAAYGADTRYIQSVNTAITTMAYVSRLPNGERDFMFVYGADQTWEWPAQDQDILHDRPIAHFGAATLQVREDVRERYMTAMQKCKQAGCLISFDPNFRDDLWKERITEWRSWVSVSLQMSDVVKMSDEELLLYTACDSLEAAMLRIRDETAALVWVTCGADGAKAVLKKQIVQAMIEEDWPNSMADQLKHPIIDTTGAGDAFVAAMLFQLANALEDHDSIGKVRDAFLQDETLQRTWMSKANQIAGSICRQTGAMPNAQTLEHWRT